MEDLLTLENLISLLTLSVLEIVLGIDNVIFISILAGKLPKSQEAKARNWGLVLAAILRLALLGCISWIIKMDKTLLSLWGHNLDGKDIILIIGGLFLMAKSTSEIHGKLEAVEMDEQKSSKGSAVFTWILVQIVLINLVFSFDSILTAIGLVKEIPIMVASVVISTAIMFIFAKSINDFINRHPTFKILALAFLIMIGFLLMVEAFDVHVDKGYIYFAMAFAIVIEAVNMRLRKKTTPVQLRNQHLHEEHDPAQITHS
ncbi:MAG: TerC family protein [Raineya sp.]|jgi:predicted tellurium resistance membrane protein TerC|nr:TerC family protein [Raineya sp.]